MLGSLTPPAPGVRPEVAGCPIRFRRQPRSVTGQPERDRAFVSRYPMVTSSGTLCKRWRDAGLEFDGYDETRVSGGRATTIEGLEVKVVRPHDMPQLVALGQIDLACHRPGLLDGAPLPVPFEPGQRTGGPAAWSVQPYRSRKRGSPADTIEEALAIWRRAGRPFVRVASEFMGTADHYARSRHLWRYRVIPIAGASEGFVPEDAELLIEGTETGRTLRENRLKPIDLLYRSTTCVIGHTGPMSSGQREHCGRIARGLRRPRRRLPERSATIFSEERCSCHRSLYTYLWRAASAERLRSGLLDRRAGRPLPWLDRSRYSCDHTLGAFAHALF